MLRQGYAIACQTVVEGDLEVVVPPQEKIQQRLVTGQTAADVMVPAGYDPDLDQTIKRIPMTLKPPSMEDQTSDWARLKTALLRRNQIEITPGFPAGPAETTLGPQAR